MKDFLLFLINQLVDQPDAVQIDEESLETETIYKLKLAKEDMGKVIGKEGKIIHALRTLLKVRAIKEGKMARLEILEG
ncbi:KH domain-containing protein [Candidatus Gottesmanbacteria bacterium]|nr:KH domain-containing protein [Candidatus Gottesmanbacteria bacterium]